MTLRASVENSPRSLKAGTLKTAKVTQPRFGGMQNVNSVKLVLRFSVIRRNLIRPPSQPPRPDL